MNSTLLLTLVVAMFLGTYARKIDKNIGSAATIKCLNASQTPQYYIAKFNRFEYPDEESVYSFMQCFWTDLGIWKDPTGLDEETLRDLFKEANYVDDLMAVLEECEASSENNPQPKRVYEIYTCALNSRVGDSLKKDINNILHN